MQYSEENKNIITTTKNTQCAYINYTQLNIFQVCETYSPDMTIYICISVIIVFIICFTMLYIYLNDMIIKRRTEPPKYSDLVYELPIYTPPYNPEEFITCE